MSNVKRLRVVVDTNLIVSAALIPQSPPDRLVKSWLRDLFDLLTSKEQLEEMNYSAVNCGVSLRESSYRTIHPRSKLMGYSGSIIKDAAKKERLKSYPLFLNRIAELTQNLEFAAELVEPVPEVDLPINSRDPKDDYILAQSLGGKADYLVTGDKDLLILSTNSGLGMLKIVSVKQFLSEIILFKDL